MSAAGGIGAAASAATYAAGRSGIGGTGTAIVGGALVSFMAGMGFPGWDPTSDYVGARNVTVATMAASTAVAGLAAHRAGFSTLGIAASAAAALGAGLLGAAL